MTGAYVASIDQGTASSRCLLFDERGRIVSVAQKEHRQLFPRAAQAARTLRPDCQKHRVEIPPQLIEGEVPAQPFAQTEFRSQLADARNLGIEHRARQPKGRDAVAQHPARMRVRVK